MAEKDEGKSGGVGTGSRSKELSQDKQLLAEAEAGLLDQGKRVNALKCRGNARERKGLVRPRASVSR